MATVNDPVDAVCENFAAGFHSGVAKARAKLTVDWDEAKEMIDVIQHNIDANLSDHDSEKRQQIMMAMVDMVIGYAIDFVPRRTTELIERFNAA